MKKSVIVVLSILGLAGLATCAGVVSSAMSADKPQAVVIDQSPGQMVGTAVPKPTAAPGVADGDWLVGKDIKSGTYRSPGATEGFCAWVVRKGEDQDAEVVAVGSANKPNQPQRAVVKAGQVFQTNGCKPWIKQ